jgi:hypothetical protein
MLPYSYVNSKMQTSFDTIYVQSISINRHIDSTEIAHAALFLRGSVVPETPALNSPLLCSTQAKEASPNTNSRFQSLQLPDFSTANRPFAGPLAPLADGILDKCVVMICS